MRACVYGPTPKLVHDNGIDGMNWWPVTSTTEKIILQKQIFLLQSAKSFCKNQYHRILNERKCVIE